MARIKSSSHHISVARSEHAGKTIGGPMIDRNLRPATSQKTPASQYTYIGTAQGGQLGGKTYIPRPPIQKHRRRIIYTAPPMKGFVPAKRGAKVQHEIRYFQESTDPVLPLLPFERLVREILQDLSSKSKDNPQITRIAPNAILALRIAAEAHIVHVMRISSLLTLHGKRLTLLPRDIHLCRKLMDCDLDI